jgi:hypothetical protein
VKGGLTFVRAAHLPGRARRIERGVADYHTETRSQLVLERKIHCDVRPGLGSQARSLCRPVLMAGSLLTRLTGRPDPLLAGSRIGRLLGRNKGPHASSWKSGELRMSGADEHERLVPMNDSPGQPGPTADVDPLTVFDPARRAVGLTCSPDSWCR